MDGAVETGSQSKLPADRAFVVQFFAGEAADEPFQGRAEHLTSGQVFHFTSLGALAEFLRQFLSVSTTPNKGEPT